MIYVIFIIIFASLLILICINIILSVMGLMHSNGHPQMWFWSAAPCTGKHTHTHNTHTGFVSHCSRHTDRCGVHIQWYSKEWKSCEIIYKNPLINQLKSVFPISFVYLFSENRDIYIYTFLFGCYHCRCCLVPLLHRTCRCYSNTHRQTYI